MSGNLVISDATRLTAGILLLTVVLVEFGGWYMLQMVRRRVELTGFQQAFARAGHAHAGVLVILSLVVQLLPMPRVARTCWLRWGGAACRWRRSSCPLASFCPRWAPAERNPIA